jgi:hypothetical protein
MKKDRNTMILVEITQSDCHLISEHTFADPEYVDRFEPSQEDAEKLTAHFTAEELDDLLGYIAAEANHTKSKKVKKTLDALYEKLLKFEP